MSLGQYYNVENANKLENRMLLNISSEEVMNYNKKSITDIDFREKKVLLRCDFNVPLHKETGVITDEGRITASLPTIEYLLEKGAAVIICSHLGRPGGEWKPKLSLKVVAECLSQQLGTPIIMAEDVIGSDAR